MRGCFICGNNKSHGKFGVAVWQASSDSKRFGLGSLDPFDNQICCSFREGEFATREEAVEAVLDSDVTQFYGESETMDYDDSDYGPPDSDQYDYERQWC